MANREACDQGRKCMMACRFAVRLRRKQEPAGLTPGRPDEGVWAYASDPLTRWANEFRRSALGLHEQLHCFVFGPVLLRRFRTLIQWRCKI
jgi:hypothetical protein